MRAALALCHQMGRFLFEARPDICPEGFLAQTEIELWGLYYERLEQVRGQHRRRK